MKLLLLSLCVSLAAAHDLIWHEPETLDCYCAGCGDSLAPPTVGSFDGTLFEIFSDKKTSLSHWGSYYPELQQNDVCKFGLRVVTKADILYDPTHVHYDWAGFGFGRKNNPSKSWRNFLFGQDGNGEGLLGIRGQGMQILVPITDNPHYEVQNQGSFDCTWKVEKMDNHEMQLRSDCCPYAFNWLPNGVQTCWEFWVSHDFYAEGHLGGMCGDCDRDNRNDVRSCPFGPAYHPLPSDWLHVVDQNCTSGDNQGEAFPGGGRM